MNKRTAIVALVGLNLLLLAALVFSVSSLPTAHAQSRGRPGDYLMATAQIHEDYDAVAIINVPKALMHFFVPREAAGGPKMTYTITRDLNRDFERVGGR